MFGGGPVGVIAEPWQVMPADAITPEELAALRKGPRVVAVNDPKGRPGPWVGPWHVRAEGDTFGTWHRTKRDGVKEAAARLAIRDFHAAARAAAEAEAAR